MSELQTRVKHALSENRILVIGAQVLLGFQFCAVLEPGFDRLPVATQHLKLGGLALLLAAIATRSRWFAFTGWQAARRRRADVDRVRRAQAA